jgi:tripartite-type tricarboxylate transporter receptor subunit TctC
MMITRLVLAFAMTVASWQATAQTADSFPSHPVQLLVQFPPGGSVDATARALARAAEKELGVPVVIVNRPGAGGTISLAQVARSRADGYTLGVAGASNIAITPQIQKISYDPLQDFSPISAYAKSGIFLAVRADSPYKSLDDLLADMKVRPGAISVGMPTLGSINHLAMVRMLRERGLKAESVAFGGNVITSLIGGDMPVACISGEILPYVTSGKVRLLASFTKTSVPALSQVPWIGASGFPWESESWLGIVAPAKLPEGVRAKLEAAFMKAALDPEFQKGLPELVMFPINADGKALGQMMKQSHAKLGELIKVIGLKAD